MWGGGEEGWKNVFYKPLIQHEENVEIIKQSYRTLQKQTLQSLGKIEAFKESVRTRLF